MQRMKMFDENGFVAVPQFCNSAELSSIESALARFIDEKFSQLPAEDVFYEDKSKPESLKQIQRMHEHDDFFGSFMNSRPKRLALPSSSPASLSMLSKADRTFFSELGERVLSSGCCCSQAS